MKDFVREMKREICLEDMGSKIDVFSECESERISIRRVMVL